MVAAKEQYPAAWIRLQIITVRVPRNQHQTRAGTPIQAECGGNSEQPLSWAQRTLQRRAPMPLIRRLSCATQSVYPASRLAVNSETSVFVVLPMTHIRALMIGRSEGN